MDGFNIFTKNIDKTESVSVALEKHDEGNQEKKKQIKLVLSIVMVLFSTLNVFPSFSAVNLAEHKS